MSRSTRSFRNRDDETRHGVEASAARKKRPAALPQCKSPAGPGDAPGSAAEAVAMGPAELPTPGVADEASDQGPKTDQVPFFSGMVNDQVYLYQAEVARRAAMLSRQPSFWRAPADPPILTAGEGAPSSPAVGNTARNGKPDATGPLPPETNAGIGAFAGEPADVSEGGEASPSGGPHRITRDFPLLLDTASTLPVARPKVHADKPDKRKTASRGQATRRARQTARMQTNQGLVGNRTELVRHTKILIVALQEALDYDPVGGHNQRPPALWNEDLTYLSELGSLVLELRRLNSLLEMKRRRKAKTDQAVINLARHLDQFLHSYASWFGKGAAVLTIGVIAGLLQHAGLDPTPVWSAVKLLH